MTIKLHIHCSDWQGRPFRKTYIISEFSPGQLDIVDETRPRCEADRTAPFYVSKDETIVFEVEPG